MKVKHIDHIGIAVKTIDQAGKFYTEGLGLNIQEIETVAEQKVNVAFIPITDSEVELLESTEPDGPVAKFIDSKGEGVQHIAFRVENLEEASTFFQENFGLSISEQENFGELIFSFIPMEGTNLELLQSTESDGQIAKFVKKRGQGIHHISFEVDDIQAELDRLKARGIKLINEKPYLNAHKDLVAFIHPKSTFGILIELIQTGH